MKKKFSVWAARGLLWLTFDLEAGGQGAKRTDSGAGLPSFQFCLPPSLRPESDGANYPPPLCPGFPSLMWG